MYYQYTQRGCPTLIISSQGGGYRPQFLRYSDSFPAHCLILPIFSDSEVSFGVLDLGWPLHLTLFFRGQKLRSSKKNAPNIGKRHIKRKLRPQGLSFHRHFYKKTSNDLKNDLGWPQIALFQGGGTGHSFKDRVMIFWLTAYFEVYF